MELTFVETLVFSARWDKRLGFEDLRALQEELLEFPGRGDSIPGCPLLRKIRCGDRTRRKGKRGGFRVVYVYTPAAQRIDLITVFGKDEKDDLTKDEVKELCELARALRDEATNAAGKGKTDRKEKRHGP